MRGAAVNDVGGSVTQHRSNLRYTTCHVSVGDAGPDKLEPIQEDAGR